MSYAFKKYVDPRKVLWFLLIINVTAGLSFSEITAVRRVYVKNVPIDGYKKIKEIVQKFQHVPFFFKPNDEVLSEILDSFHLYGIQKKDRMFTYHIDLLLNKPIAKSLTGEDLYLLEDGSLSNLHNIQMELPLISIPPELIYPQLNTLHGWEMLTVVYFIQRLQRSIPGRKIAVYISPSSAIHIEIDHSLLIVLGLPIDIHKKMDTLESILNAEKDWLEKVKYINLISPEHCTYA